MSLPQSLFAIIVSPKRCLFSRLGLMLLPVMLLASGCQNRILQPVLIEPEEWYRGMVSADRREVEDALKRACFPTEAKDVMADINNPQGLVQSVEELPAKPSEGWTPLKVRMVVDGQPVFIDRHLTAPYLVYSDKADQMLIEIDRFLGANSGSEALLEAHAERSSQPYCFNIMLSGDDPSGDD